jgi:hypothetical protein
MLIRACVQMKLPEYDISSDSFSKLHVEVAGFRVYTWDGSSGQQNDVLLLHGLISLTSLGTFLSFPPLHVNIDTCIPEDPIKRNGVCRRYNCFRYRIEYYKELDYDPVETTRLSSKGTTNLPQPIAAPEALPIVCTS